MGERSAQPAHGLGWIGRCEDRTAHGNAPAPESGEFTGLGLVDASDGQMRRARMLGEEAHQVAGACDRQRILGIGWVHASDAAVGRTRSHRLGGLVRIVRACTDEQRRTGDRSRGRDWQVASAQMHAVGIAGQCHIDAVIDDQACCGRSSEFTKRLGARQEFASLKVLLTELEAVGAAVECGLRSIEPGQDADRLGHEHADRPLPGCAPGQAQGEVAGKVVGAVAHALDARGGDRVMQLQRFLQGAQRLGRARAVGQRDGMQRRPVMLRGTGDGPAHIAMRIARREESRRIQARKRLGNRMASSLEPFRERAITDREPGEVLEHAERLEGPIAVGIDDAEGRRHGFLQRRPGIRARRRPASDATISTPMAQIREIKKRMVAVRTIQRITKTMQMIATAKFTASLARAKATRPYTDRIRQLVGEVAATAGDVSHPLLQGGGSSGKVLVLVIGSDRGLCGAYNGNVLRTAMVRMGALKAEGKKVVVHTAGKKAFAFFKYQQMLPEERLSFGDRPKFEDIQALADRYMGAFVAGEFEQVVVCSMRFVSNARQIAESVQLLPLSMPQASKGAVTASYEFSPGAAEILDDLLPRSVKVSLFQAFNDAVVSENVMRMVAMKAATDNASGLGRTLKRNYNRARQARITTELTEIVSGAAALG